VSFNRDKKVIQNLLGDEFVEIHMTDIRFFDRGSSTSSVSLATLAGLLGAPDLSVFEFEIPVMFYLSYPW